MTLEFQHRDRPQAQGDCWIATYGFWLIRISHLARARPNSATTRGTHKRNSGQGTVARTPYRAVRDANFFPVSRCRWSLGVLNKTTSFPNKTDSGALFRGANSARVGFSEQ